jgi:hypothetical protein
LTDRARHDVADGGLGDKAEAYQQPPERYVVVALLGKCDCELIRRDDVLLDQQLAQPEFLTLFRHRMPAR